MKKPKSQARKGMLVLFLILVFLVSGATSANTAGAELQEGDLIFQESNGPLSPAIREATGSTWTHVGLIVKVKGQWQVLEAYGGVEATPLMRFVNRYPKGSVLVKRLKPEIKTLSPQEVASLKRNFINYYGKPYDSFFEWSNEKIYCSELVYKLFVDTLDLPIGEVQKFKDLRVDGPEVRKLIAQKQKEGHVVDFNEPIITPVAQFESPLLKIVKVYRE